MKASIGSPKEVHVDRTRTRSYELMFDCAKFFFDLDARNGNREHQHIPAMHQSIATSSGFAHKSHVKQKMLYDAASSARGTRMATEINKIIKNENFDRHMMGVTDCIINMR